MPGLGAKTATRPPCAGGASGLLCGLAAAQVAVAGCTAYTPPPVAVTHRLAAAEPEDSIVVAVATGLSGTPMSDTGWGGELRVVWQTRDRVALGVGLAGGRNLSWEPPREPRTICPEGEGALFGCVDTGFHHIKWLFALRVFAQVNTRDEPDLAWVFGAGGGLADTGLRYLTLDAGAIASTAPGNIDAYLAPVVGLSIPVNPGPPMVAFEKATTTLFFGAGAGVMVNGDGAVRGAAELGLDRAFRFRGDGNSLLTVSGSLGVRKDP